MEELRACVRGKVGNPKTAIGPELERARQACGGAIVRPCVIREEQKQAAGVAAPSAPKDASAATDAPLEIRTSFVAPPRTIADITAILDSEKPDEAQIAQRKATADASPNGLSGPKLAQFLFDRGAARALLARNKEALADGLQALELAKHGMDLRFLARTSRCNTRRPGIQKTRSQSCNFRSAKATCPGAAAPLSHRCALSRKSQSHSAISMGPAVTSIASRPWCPRRAAVPIQSGERLIRFMVTTGRPTLTQRAD
jgi:hypothetical protein